jgi:cytochrome oxidase Cu insertion factor (SCO1/SenC/PrrC family)
VKARSSSRLALVVIAALFILPLVVAWLMYTEVIDFKPGSTRNLGQLVQPPLPLPWAGVYLDGAQAESAREAFLGHWLILHAVPRSCADACLQTVVNLRQVHRATGREQGRIRLALLHDQGDAASVDRLQAVYAPLRLIEDPDGAVWRALETAAGQGTAAADPRGNTYLVDPLGNIMMHYAAGSDPNDLKTDLKRLLTWSKLDEQS